jgi:hypothetical protein
MKNRIAIIGGGLLLALVVALVIGSQMAGGGRPQPKAGYSPGVFQPPGFGQPDPSVAPSAVAPGGSAGVAPYVQGFGPQSGSTVPTPGTKPTTAPVDGCDHDYGTANQCVPWNFPANVTDRCGWLSAHHMSALRIHGRDRLGLDTNHDQIACGKGDR